MTRRALSVTADVCLIIAAFAGLWRMWDSYRPRSSVFKRNDSPAEIVGKTLKGVDIDWNKTGANLVMVINKDCHFCSESAPFYRRLTASADPRVQIAALFTHDVAPARAYLDRLGLRLSVIRGSISFEWPVMTPTLMLCDATGKVTRVWIGKLTAAEELEVLSAVGAASSVPNGG